MYFPKILTVLVLSLGFQSQAFEPFRRRGRRKIEPGGSFVAKTAKVQGTARKTADGVVAENVVIDATSLATGVSLRDNHLKKRILTDKFPQIKLVKAEGKNGSGKGVVEIMGQKQNVSGTYTVEGKMLNAEFKMKLGDLQIKDVNYMGIGVKDEVVIHVNIPISEGAPAPERATASGKKTARK